jgi:hypothetical protein
MVLVAFALAFRLHATEHSVDSDINLDPERAPLLPSAQGKGQRDARVASGFDSPFLASAEKP